MAQASRRHRRPRKKRRPLPAWLWLLAGLALGLGTALAVHLYREGWGSWTRSSGRQEPPAAQGPASRPASAPAEARKLDFDFYTLLPEMEVPVPEEAPTGKGPGGAAAPLPRRPGVYLLQVGSFRRFQDADALKARLALLGIGSRIERVSVEGSAGRQVWHRVRVGPFRDPQRLEQVRRRLHGEHIPALLLRVGRAPAEAPQPRR